MKKFTRDRVVPIISASVSWLIRGDTASRVFRREFGQPQQRSRQTLFGGMKMMVTEIAEIAAISRYQKVHELFAKS